MAAFLENWVVKDRSAAKVAQYRLWVGTSKRSMKEVTSEGGDGRRGTVGSWFYLAEGRSGKVDSILAGKNNQAFTVGAGGLLSVNKVRLTKSLPQKSSN